MITIPIIVDEHGDMSFFESVEHAERKLEAIDVRNEEYVAYDSEGRLLRVTIERGEAPIFFGLDKTTVDYVVIESAEDEPSHAPQLRAALVDFLERIGVSLDDPESLSLQELVSKGAAHANFTI